MGSSRLLSKTGTVVPSYHYCTREPSFPLEPQQEEGHAISYGALSVAYWSSTRCLLPTTRQGQKKVRSRAAFSLVIREPSTLQLHQALDLCSSTDVAAVAETSRQGYVPAVLAVVDTRPKNNNLGPLRSHSALLCSALLCFVLLFCLPPLRA